MLRYSVLGFLVGCLVTACTTSDLPNGSTMEERNDLDAFLAAAPDLHPCTAAEVSARFGIQLEVQRENQYTTFYGAPGSGSISTYDLRVPKSAAPATSEGKRTPMLIANLAKGAAPYDDVAGRLGAPVPGSFDVQPAGGPTVYVESYDAGRNMIIVGAGLDDPPSATEIIVNCR